MPRESTPRIDLGYGWLRGEDWWGDPMSDNMMMSDALLHPNVISMSLTGPPTFTSVGEQFIVAQGASGLWSGYDGALATRYDDRWRFVRPYKGMRIFVEELDGFYFFNGTTWVSESGGAAGVDPHAGLHYDVLCSVGYPPEPLETVLIVIIPQTMALPKNAVGSRAAASSVPRIAVQANILRNGSVIGQVLFPSNDFNAVFTVANQVMFAAGDRLTVQLTEIVPADFQTFGITLRLVVQT
jgi:Protein of unknown function (DUF2793)